MIKTFRDQWLEEYYFCAKDSSRVPGMIRNALKRKLDIMHIAINEAGLRVPPGNLFERLQGRLMGWCSIRVNQQYRLIFQWESGQATDVYLDSHTYR